MGAPALPQPCSHPLSPSFRPQQDFSYALGQRGATRKKLAKASGCILEYVGHTAYFCGTKRERQLGRDYLRWLLKQRNGDSNADFKGRDDVTVLEVPSESVGFLTGHRGESLRKVELETDSFCFTDGNKADCTEGHERLLIFGHSESGRRQAKVMFEEKIADHKQMRNRGSGPPRRDDRRDDRRDVSAPCPERVLPGPTTLIIIWASCLVGPPR